MMSPVCVAKSSATDHASPRRSASPKPCAAVIASSRRRGSGEVSALRSEACRSHRLIGEDADIAVSVLESCGDGQVLGRRSPLADTVCSDRAVDQEGGRTPAQRGLLTAGSHRIAKVYRLSRTPA